MDYSLIWLLISIALIVIGVLFKKYTISISSIGTIFSAIMDARGMNKVYIQIITSLTISTVCILIYVVIARKILSNVNRDYKIEEIVGERCKVVEKIDNFAGCGLVNVKGREWSASSLDGADTYAVGETLTVIAIEGVKVICKK